MAQYPDDNLKNLSGQVMRHRPQLRPDLARDWLNWRMRSILDRRPFWAGLVKDGVLSFPKVYSKGTVSLTRGSVQAAGVGADWPTNDLVSTACQQAIDQLGPQEIIPDSMAGIDRDSILLLDPTGTPEAVAVQDVGDDYFTAVVRYPHEAPFSVWKSSLAGLQFKMAGVLPIFTVMAVPNPNLIVLDLPWGAADVAGQPYQVLKVYVTFGCDVRQIMSVSDPAYGSTLSVHVPTAHLNSIDPRRMSQGSIAPSLVVDHGPNANGRMCWEVWPHITSERQLPFQVYQHWADMKRPGDTPPPFMNGAVLVAGAIADAKRTKLEASDPYYDLRAARDWEARFEMGVQEIMQADNAKMQQQYTWNTSLTGGVGVGSAYWQSRDRDIEAGNF